MTNLMRLLSTLWDGNIFDLSGENSDQKDLAKCS